MINRGYSPIVSLHIAFKVGSSDESYNTQGAAHLAEGMDADEVISRLEGIRCGFKPTSCPDQLAKAIRQALNEG